MMVSLNDIWADDRLGRRQDGDTVYRFLMGQIAARRARGTTASYVLNIDAEWGHGKSYFLNRFATQLSHAGHVVARVNAWESDLTNEPMIAIMAAVEEALQPHFSRSTQVKKQWKRLISSSGPLAVSLVKGVATSLLKKHTDTFLDDVGEALGAKSGTEPLTGAEDESLMGEGIAAVVEKLGDDFASGLIEAHRQHLGSITSFRANLAAMAEGIRAEGNGGSFIFVLVDELDRCRPSHAINLLESIKHLFNTDGIVFLIATNTEQLAASVKAVYGNDFNAKAYLLRFFDRTYRFREAEPKMFISHLFAVHGIDSSRLNRGNMESVHVTAEYFAAFDMSLRDIEQCFEIFATVHSLWESRMPLQLGLIWPLICMYHMGRTQEFELLRGKPSRSTLDAIFPFDRVVHTRQNYDRVMSQPTTNVATTRDFTLGYMHGNNTSLNDIANSSNQSFGQQLATEYFAEEFAQLHGNSFNTGNPPASVTRQYGDLVKLAVQFKAIDDSDDDATAD